MSQFGNLLRNVGAKHAYKNYYNGLYASEQAGWKKSPTAFAELAQICRDRNIPLKIVLIPELHSLAEDYEFEPIESLIVQVGATDGGEVLNPDRRFT